MSAAIAQPLDPRWLDVVESVAPRTLGRADREGSALIAQIVHASELYTRERSGIGAASELLAARLRFFLPRDLPKIEGPLAELAARSALPEGRVWRVLDLGAGLGTTTLGVAGFAKRLGVERIDATAVERDEASLDVMTQLAREAERAGLIAPIELEARADDIERSSRDGTFDLAVVGLALNELFADREDRIAAREALLRGIRAQTIVVIEPAIRSITRELQMLRDRFAASSPPYVFAPCLRDGPCPMLRHERDWCHDELPFALPEKLADLAADAGLRRERLTYAYLTLRADPSRLWDRDPRSYRIVGGPIASKGKTEWLGCGAPGLVKLRQLDRERTPALEGAARGTLLRLDREPPDGSDLRVRPDVRIERLLR